MPVDIVDALTIVEREYGDLQEPKGEDRPLDIPPDVQAEIESLITNQEVTS